ncbi:DNA sulfur modification protein DndB [Candidatus Merdisoma sp. JLR.KK006]|uniref:DNA sulfur modification protein DndB n=1 Tax=Candidatus Merdisoma sp. JLR.KK006 TaxID=3112626 RepID=UPI002FF427CB
MRIPVIRGHMGDWGYYTGIMKFQQVSELVTPSVDEFCNPSCLNDLLQRQLTDNYLSIKEYILHENQRFFNAIVLAIYDGDPKWLEIEFGEEYEEYSNVGFLELNEEVRIFPVDGQHRVKGIIEALKENEQVAEEEVPVIFIAHRNDIEGKRRTRKLFSTLNRRAKPVGDNYQIALDEDDIVAIVTRELVEECSLFQGERMCNNRNKQIAVTNTNAFTSLVALYQCNDYLIQNFIKLSDKKMKQYKLYRPANETIEDALEYVKKYWNAFIDNISAVKDYLLINDNPALNYRNKNGGNILFRPIGIIEFVKASYIISERSHISFEDTLRRLNDIPMDLNTKVWRGVMWDGKKIINRVNLTLIRFLIMFLESENNLTDDEMQRLTDLYIVATNYEGNRKDALTNMKR